METVIENIESMDDPGESWATLDTLRTIRDLILRQAEGDPGKMIDIQLLEMRPVIMKTMRYRRQLFWLSWPRCLNFLLWISHLF